MTPIQEEEGVKCRGCQKSMFDGSELGLDPVLIRPPHDKLTDHLAEAGY